MSQQLLELADRCEKAPGAFFELNSAIARSDFFREEHGDMGDDEIPDFGDSLDAALSLVPRGFGWNLQGNTKIFYAVVHGHYSKACSTPALALSAAALRARASTLPPAERS